MPGPPGSQAEIADRWLTNLRAATPDAEAAQLYSGRSFGRVRETATALGADIGILSAGLGYVKGHTRIPAYDLTVTAGKSASAQSFVVGRFDSPSWWSAISGGPFASSLIEDADRRKRVLVCLSAAYARLVATDLLTLAEAAPGRLRIFGQRIDAALPEDLHQWVLPYDRRLDALSPGIRLDFAARALVHFVAMSAGKTGDIADDRRSVAAAMAAVPAPSAPRPQRRMDDAALRQEIRSRATQGESASRLLAKLRAEGLSCEQARFARLFAEVST
jgi:hypothetical protein